MADRKFVRRNRVDERIAAPIAMVAGFVAALSGAEPTGSSVVDALLVFAAGAAVTWASASAPWWATSLACGVAAAIALDPLIAAIGAIGFVGGLIVGAKQRSNPELRAVSGGIAVNVLLRSELEGFLGLSALIGVPIGLALIVIGLLRRKSALRKPAFAALGGGLAAAIVAVLLVAVGASAARPDVSSANDAARRGIDALDDGAYDEAARLFDDAAASFDAAADSLSGGLALPGQLVPVVSQNVRAGADLAEVAAASMRTAAASLREIDPSELAVVGGAIDVDAVREAEEPLVAVREALDDLARVSSDVRSQWLAGPLQRELDELDDDIASQQPRLANAIDAVRVAPDVLGGAGERRYLVLFTSPAEARGLGGFVGNYAELVIDDGAISVTDFARRSELERVVGENDVQCADCPQEFLDVYGRFGFTTGENGGVGTRGWSNITMPVHFPYVAETAAALYPLSGGRGIDGVIVMDPYVVQALMAFTGPISVPEFDTVVESAGAADFILREQYLLAAGDVDGDLDNAERIDALETLGTEVIARLLAGALPEPAELAAALAPLVEERRLLVWTDDETEQEVFDRIGLLGSLPELGDDGGFSVAVTNASASKIDAFLEMDTVVEVSESADGQAVLLAEVVLANRAPSSGLPQYVIGNAVGLPTGSSRLIVAFYGPPTIDSILLDGDAIAIGSTSESGWARYETTIDLGAGESARYELTFDLPGIAPGVAEPVLFDQPLVRSS